MILWPPFLPAEAGGTERIATVITTKAAMRVILVQDISRGEKETSLVEWSVWMRVRWNWTRTVRVSAGVMCLLETKKKVKCDKRIASRTFLYQVIHQWCTPFLGDTDSKSDFTCSLCVCAFVTWVTSVVGFHQMFSASLVTTRMKMTKEVKDICHETKVQLLQSKTSSNGS